jgi:hypothetical protein
MYFQSRLKIGSVYFKISKWAFVYAAHYEVIQKEKQYTIRLLQLNFVINFQLVLHVII